MRKFKKLTSSFCSFFLAAALLLGSATPVLAESVTPPQEPPLQITQSEALTTPESTVPDDFNNASSEPESSEPADSSSALIDSSSASTEPGSESLPTENPPVSSADNSAPEEPKEAPEDGDFVPIEEEPEEAPFVPSAIADFSQTAEFTEDGQARLYVTLNRNDVQVQYQWQVKMPIEAPELLYDYRDGEETSYYFPYADITEAELLEMNPDATWPGIEMYLAAVEAANGDASAVLIENGTENTIVAETENKAAYGLELPDWQDIDGATESSYTFDVDEENAEAVYRCVITITDEAYLAQAAAETQDAYGPQAAEAPEEGETAESAPTEQEEADTEADDTPADTAEPIAAEEASPADVSTEPAFTPETQLITEEAMVQLPQAALFALNAHTGVEQVRQDA